MTPTRRTYGRQFKLDAVALLESSGRKVQEIKAELGIGKGCLSDWRKELEKLILTEPGPGLSDIEQILRLERELRIVRHERDILEKRSPSSSRPTQEIPLHRGSLPRVPGGAHAPGVGGAPKRVLGVADTLAEYAKDG